MTSVRYITGSKISISIKLINIASPRLSVFVHCLSTVLFVSIRQVAALTCIYCNIWQSGLLSIQYSVPDL